MSIAFDSWAEFSLLYDECKKNNAAMVCFVYSNSCPACVQFGPKFEDFTKKWIEEPKTSNGKLCAENTLAVTSVCLKKNQENRLFYDDFQKAFNIGAIPGFIIFWQDSYVFVTRDSFEIPQFIASIKSLFTVELKSQTDENTDYESSTSADDNKKRHTLVSLYETHAQKSSTDANTVTSWKSFTPIYEKLGRSKKSNADGTMSFRELSPMKKCLALTFYFAMERLGLA
jgi:hypothetical protein